MFDYTGPVLIWSFYAFTTWALIPNTALHFSQYKPVSTRKLRRRGNEPAPIVEKRRKPVSNTLQLLLEEREVDEDLKLINKSKLINMKKSRFRD